MMDLSDEIESYSPQSNPKNSAEEHIQMPGEQGSKNTVPLIDNLYPPKQAEQGKQEEKQEEKEQKGCTRFCSIEYYEQFWQVSETEITSRLRSAIVPPYSGDFLEKIKPQPDMYGPVWVMVTLVLLMGFVHNFSNYLLSIFTTHEAWNEYFFNLALVRHALIVVTTFGAGAPLLLYFLLRCLKGLELSFPQLMCLYGYGLFPFVPALVVCIVPLAFLQWIILILAMVGSVLFLVMSLKGELEEERKTLILGGVTVGLIQLTFTLLLKLMFVTLII